jgi:hypothetical protein
VLGECGRAPLYVEYVTKCVKYWLNVLIMDDTRYPKIVYKMLLNHDSVGRTNWASKVKNILFKYGFGDIWFGQGVGDRRSFLYIFKQRIVDCATQE